MRRILWASLLSVLTLLPGYGNAGEGPLPQITISESEKVKATNPSEELYRGYVLNLSLIASRNDFAEITNALRQQLDIVEDIPLSPRVLNFFHTIPIVADELACLESDVKALACFGPAPPNRSQHAPHEFTVWDSQKSQWINPDSVVLASEARGGVVNFHPHISTSNAQSPVMLHELLHAYHARLMPEGYQNQGILFHYNLAKSKNIYPAEAYLAKNQMEFFAVTASIFLYGKDAAHEPFTRADLKEKQPDYYRYLVNLFGFDPDRAPSTSPVASAR